MILYIKNTLSLILGPETKDILSLYIYMEMGLPIATLETSPHAHLKSHVLKHILQN